MATESTEDTESNDIIKTHLECISITNGITDPAAVLIDSSNLHYRDGTLP